MLSALLLPLVAMASPTAAVGAGPPLADPPVKVWLNDERFVRGERARVFVRSDRDGYLVVLHAEPGGRVRVLFPLDPTDDNYVRADKKYEIRGRGDREAFTVYDARGTGMVLAAFSPDPFRFDSFVRQDHWDYRVEAFRVGEDPEADLGEIVRQMAGGSPYDYDLVRYEVGERVAYGPPSGGWWYGAWWYDGWYRPWRSGITIGIGFGPSWAFSCWTCAWFYDPWFFDPFWGPFAYHRVVFHRPLAWYPYWWWDAWWYRPYYLQPTVVIANYYAGPFVNRGLIYRTPGGPFGVRRYGLSYVQPARRVLSFYTPGQNVIEPRSRTVVPPTDIVGPAVVRLPVRETAPATGPSTPRRLERQRVEWSPAGSERPRAIREVPFREPVPQAPERRTEPRLGREGPGRGWVPVEPRRAEPPRLERRLPERRDPPGVSRSFEPRARMPSVFSSPRSTGPARMGVPGASLRSLAPMTGPRAVPLSPGRARPE